MEKVGRSSRSGGWRDAFLNRRKGETRSASREASREPREPREPRQRPAVDFDEKAMLEQDQARIDQLLRRETRNASGGTARPPVKKPPAPPKVTPYKFRSDTAPPSPSSTTSERNSPEAKPDLSESADPPTELVPTSPQPPPSPPSPPEPQPQPVEVKEPKVTVVPKSGALFTAKDIDSIMDVLSEPEPKEAKAAKPQRPTPGQCGQNFEDISQEFYSRHRMEVPKRKADEKVDTDFDVPDRSALRDQIRAIDSWLEEDTGREDVKGVTARPRQSAARAPATLQEAMARGAGDGDDSAAEAELFSKLEALKSRETVPPAEIKELVNRAKPLLPGMNLEQLVRALDLFSSSYEDHDFYLHILGELPVQVRSITCELLTKCLCILQRLRLNEETYLELFSMQAMNMIRAQQPAAARAPRAPRRPAGEAKEVPKATLAPFSGRMLVQMGNSLTQLAAKHPSRFMDVFQEQLALAIPLLSKEDCELVSPALATSQLMPDVLRRAFLERCAEVDAGSPLVAPDDAVAPDIAKYQQDAEIFRRRSHSFRNIFVIEASLRKETWAFFTSLPAEVRSYLDRVQDTCKELRHQGANSFAKQVAEVLGQLGVVCELNRMAGPLELHLVVKAVGDTEIVYECCEADAYCAARQDQRTSPPTVETKLRQKLLQRMGYQLVHMNVWEWNRLSEAQRINYMVKLQSLPA